jgi:Neisseria PilC beta-propeller domain
MRKISFKPLMLSASLLALLTIGIKYSLAVAPFTPSLQPVGYVAQDDVTNYDLRSGSERLFRPEYQRNYWSGNLYSYPVDAAGNVNLGAEDWTDGAASKIDTQNYATGRYIGTMKDDGSKIPFLYASLSITQQTALGTATVVDFLRGDRSKEKPTGIYRQRASALGDIIHSRPYFVADPTNPTVFVGANDGMLHAIDQSAGTERWAYMPSMLISKIKNLSTDPYVHDYFVDGQITIGNIQSGGANKRILVGSLGAGGRGIYALDITGSAGLKASSNADAAAKILWEITPSTINYATPTNANDYSNLGYTYGTPIVTKVGAVDAVVFGNGYNNGGDYQAYLYVVNANTGQRIRAIKAGSSGSASNINGLFNSQVLDTDGDGSADTAYAGDLNGTMWKFNLTTGVATALLETVPLQPITGTPGVGAHPSGGYMVNFATGSMLSPSEETNTDVHYVYGVWDKLPTATVSQSNLVTQTLTGYTATFAASAGPIPIRTVSTKTVTWATDRGWKVALPAGEKVVGEGSFLENGRFYFNSHNPTVSTTIGSTTTSIKGTNWLMELDYLTGGTKNAPFFDLSLDVKLDNADRLKDAAGLPILTAQGIPVGKFISTGVMSQPILVQLTSLNNTLFNQNPNIDVPVPVPPTDGGPGVAGGHFDEDVYYTSLNCTSNCKSTDHVHQYDDKYDVTGVNMLNASNSVDNLSNAIASTGTAFKVIAQNQYLNPAVKIHIGKASYLFDVDAGYVSIQGFVTSAALDLATLPTYTRNNIGSLAINMPTDALSSRDWWGNGDIRAGLHPTKTGCVKQADGGNDGNMYQPINPPVNGTNGPGTKGWSSATTPATATGVRHNGALVIQVIKSDTPNSAIEMNVAGRPEYGWRVKSNLYSTYVLVEYTTFWHHPSGLCYGDAGWTKSPVADNSSSSPIAKAVGSTDPKLGDLSGSAGTTCTTAPIVTVGNVTTVTYSCGSVTTTIVTTVNADGSKTIVTTINGVSTTKIIPNTEGTVKTGGDERGLQSRTGRLSWQELIKP